MDVRQRIYMFSERADVCLHRPASELTLAKTRYSDNLICEYKKYNLALFK
jgi:hypothetical protein